MQPARVTQTAEPARGDDERVLNGVGGIGRIEGPILGTIIFFALRETLSDLGPVYLVALGAVAVVTMLLAPKGVYGYLADRFQIQLFPIARRVKIDAPPPVVDGVRNG